MFGMPDPATPLADLEVRPPKIGARESAQTSFLNIHWRII
jgi:hypothetical protein